MPSTLQDTYERAIATNKNSAGSMVVQMTEHDHKDRLETCYYYYIVLSFLLLEKQGSCMIHEVVNTVVDQELKLRMKDLLLTASHSLRSSPMGRRTASRRLPLPRVASMCLFSCIPC